MRVDIVVLVDNSGSMREEQEALTLRFPELIRELLDPGDADGDTHPDHAAVDDRNIGVIDPDMGTMGFTVSTCRNPDGGDNGCFRNTPAPGLGCAASYPVFLSRNPLNAAVYSPEQMSEDFTCIATLGTSGCGFEQQLKAMRVAVTDDAGPGGCNAGFLRPDSLLGLIFVTDENDCSVVEGHPEMFDPSRNGDLGPLNIRCFLHPEFIETVEDQYAAFSALRADRPGSLVVGMIVGVPPEESACIGTGDLLGGCLRVTDMEERINPAFSTELVPSCNTRMGLAFPPVRFVELAQMFGKDAYVDSVCKEDWRGAIAGITNRLVERLHDDYVCLSEPIPFYGDTCTSSCWLIETLLNIAPCPADPSCPQAWCPAGSADSIDRLLPCRDPVSGAECRPLKRDLGTIVDALGVERRQCLVRQAARDPVAFRCGDPLGDGWYYMPADWSDHECPEVEFTFPGGEPLFAPGSGVMMRCAR
jgi:hypothetical protein